MVQLVCLCRYEVFSTPSHILLYQDTGEIVIFVDIISCEQDVFVDHFLAGPFSSSLILERHFNMSILRELVPTT